MVFKELRVHGVSGTPPRQMLYTDPRSESPLDDYTKIWELPGECYDETVGAFHWGGLTAGSRWTAFWIFLAPFALANTAGWMLRRRWKGSIMAVRLVGLALTGLFASQLTTAGISVHSWLVLQGVDGAVLRSATALLLLLLFTAVVMLTGWLSTQSHFNPLKGVCRWKLIFWPKTEWMQPPDNVGEDPCVPSRSTVWDDPTTPPIQATRSDSNPAEQPTEETWIWAGDGRLWKPHSILHRLRRIHLTAAVATVALAATHGGSLGAWLVWSSGGLLVISALVLMLTTSHPQNAVVLRATTLLPLIGLLLALATVVAALVVTPPGVGGWEDIHLLNLWIAVAYGLPAILTFVLQIDSETFTDLGSFLNTSRTTGALAIAAFFGSAMGIAFVTAVERIVAPAGTHPLADQLQAQTLLANGAGWVAVWMLIMVATLILVATVFSLIPLELDDATEPRDLDELPEQARRLVYLRRVTGRVEGLLMVGALIGVAAAFGLALFGCESALECDPTLLQVDSWGAVGWLVGATALLLSIRLFLIKPLWGYGLVGLSGLVLAAGVNGFLQIEILRVELDLSNLVDASLALAVLLPAGYFFRSVVSGIGSGEKRRQTGILWDVASFWPRFFHPLGPPAYGPNAVTQLRQEVQIWREKSGLGDQDGTPDQEQAGRNAERLRLAAHSQGSLITVVSLSTMSRAEMQSLREIVTYGSPLGFIYGRLFEGTDLDGLIARVRSGEVPWRNLWRNTDYLGGRPVGVAHGISNLEAGDYGHSGYECTDEYGDSM